MKADVFSDGGSFEAELLAVARQSERRWRWFGLVGWLVGGIGVICAAVVSVQHTVVSHVVKIDKATGGTEVLSVTNLVKVPLQGIESQALAWRYVSARERYVSGVLQEDYLNVLALSDDSVGDRYDKEVRSSEGRPLKYGVRVEETVELINVTLPPDSNPAATTGRAVVRFERKRTFVGSQQPPEVSRFVSTFSFVYVPSPTGKKETLLRNPLGFKVTAYVVEPELGGSR